MIVNDVIDPGTGLPLEFPNPFAEAYARAQEFRRLTPEERWKQIADLMEIGMNMVRSSPRCAEIERCMDAQEAECQRLQRKVFSEHGTSSDSLEWKSLADLDDPRMRRLLELIGETRQET